MYQYRVTVNEAQSPIVDTLPAQWETAAQYIDDRGGIATLERRLITDYEPEIEQLFLGMKLGGKFVSRWEIFAQVEA